MATAEAGYRLDVDLPQNPFPDDRYRTDDGLAPPDWIFAEFADPNSVNSGQGSNFANGLLAAIRANATGWGTYSPIELQLAAEVDPATLADGMLVLRRTDSDWVHETPAFTAEWNADLHLLDLQPDVPFEAETTYAVILTSAVTTLSGEPLGRSRDFRRVLRGEVDPDVQPALDFVESVLGVSRDEIALAFTFTTQATWRDLLTIRERLDDNDLAPPSITFEDLEATRYQEGIFTDGPVKDTLLRGQGDAFSVAAVGTAQLYDFRGTDAIFDSDAVDGVTAPRTIPVRVQIAVPNQPAPEGGFPIVVLGHGLGQSADFAWDVAEIGAEIGLVPPFVLVAHDFPDHGMRGSGNQVADTIRYFHINNFYAMRDSFRQTAAELLQVRRLVETASGAPFDGMNREHILFAGASLGGITGATFLGVDSRVETALLSVPAGELVRILEGEEVGALAAPVIASFAGLRPTDPAYPDFFRMLIHRGLWIIGAGDPINYAPFVTGVRQLPGATRKSVLIQEGINDSVLPNATTEALARVMGVPIVDTEVACEVPGCGVSGMWQFDLADYGLEGEDAHLVSAKVREAQEQLLTYLATDGQLILDASPAP